MPANNELFTFTYMRSRQDASTWPTKTLAPSKAQIVNYNDFEYYIGTIDPAAYATNYCPNFKQADDQTVPAGSPSNLSATTPDSLGTFTLSWTNGDSSASTVIEIDKGDGLGYQAYNTVAPGTTKTIIDHEGGSWWIRVKHIKNGFSSSYSGSIKVDFGTGGMV